jgi:hypothetical protein
VPKKEALNKNILDETHTSRYSIHLGSTKMYYDLRQQFWWTRMKFETARYVLECDTCRKVKANYMKPGGLLQPLSNPVWKWDDISKDFILGLSMTARLFNLGDHLLTHQICPLHTRHHKLQCLEVCRDLRSSRAMSAQSSKDDHL